MPEPATANEKPRAKSSPLIKARLRVGPTLAVVISAVFAALATPVVMGGTLFEGPMVEGERAPVTVRIPQFIGFRDADNLIRLDRGPIVIGRGAPMDAHASATIAEVRAQSPRGAGAWLAYFAGLLLLGILYTTHLRRSHRGRLFRTQAVTLLLMVAVAAGVKAALMLTTMSVFVVPVAAAAIGTAIVVDLSAAIATGLAASLLIGLLVPFDLGAIAVLAVQALASVLVLGEGDRKTSHILLACTFGGLAAAATYAAFFYLSVGEAPLAELGDPLHSACVAAGAGGLLSGIVAVVSKPIYTYLLGDITRNKLVELEDLCNPLLKQIAEKSPGTWQHSLAMANMAEIAANSIGSNGRLVRVGAYYHDLGKSLQSKYFIENLSRGEPSPHDSLPPQISADAIFAHVTEGIRVGRQEGLPERIIDFMHMHHGDGRLEYFWAKCQESGNPDNLTEADFRYPGLRPQSRETAILAIVDAVEAASRTLKNPDEHSIRNLVQRIVYGKLHLGQLDESGLTMSELRKISDSLMETIRHAFHGRIEYPWQKEQREAESRDRVITAPETPPAQRDQADRAGSATQRIINEPRMDSLDVPRPYWRGATSNPINRGIEVAATQRLSSHPGLDADDVAPDRRRDAMPEPPGTDDDLAGLGVAATTPVRRSAVHRVASVALSDGVPTDAIGAESGRDETLSAWQDALNTAAQNADDQAPSANGAATRADHRASTEGEREEVAAEDSGPTITPASPPTSMMPPRAKAPAKE